MSFDKLTPKQKQIVVIVLVVLLTGGVGFGFYTYFYKPKQDKIAALKTDLDTKQNKLKNMKNTLRDLAATAALIKQKESELASLEKNLPLEEYVPTLLRQIENLASETRAQIRQVGISEPLQVAGTPQASTPATQPGQQPGQQPQTPSTISYREISLQFPFSGSYGSLKSFLQRISSFPLVIVVEGLKISKVGNVDRFDGTPLLSVDMPTKVYVLPRSGEESKPS